jgi:hypothetical protein
MTCVECLSEYDFEGKFLRWELFVALHKSVAKVAKLEGPEEELVVVQNLSLQQTVEAHRLVRRRDSHIF